MSKLVEYYNHFDEWGRLDREPLEFQVNWHYIKKYLPETGFILDNGAGPGKYSMELAKEEYMVTSTDLVPRLVEIARTKAKEYKLEKNFEGFHVADARDLGIFDDETFDSSLMLGPMYHLQDKQDRNQAISELRRVTRSNGIVFVAFMSRIRHIFSSLMHPENWKPNDNIDTILQFSQSGCFNHKEEQRFTNAYYYEIEDIIPFMEARGFETIQLIGSNVAAIMDDAKWNYWKNKGESEVTKIIDFVKERAGDPYILGTSSHLLYIGRKT